MNRYTVHLNENNSLTEWEVFEKTNSGYNIWIASFGSEADANLFVKIKQINDILST